MSRRLVGSWADDLPAISRARAIAALGVLVADYWPANEPALDHPDQISGHLSASRERLAYLAYPKRLRWGCYDEAKWTRFKERMAPANAAAGWKRFADTPGPIDLQSWTDNLRDAEVAETYRWLAELFWPVEVGIRSFYFGWWQSADGFGDSGRTAWHWPLRLGFLPDPKSQALLEDFHSGAHWWTRDLAHPIDLKGTGQSCDVLVSPLGLDDTRTALAPLRVGASAILLVGREPFDSPDCAVATHRLRTSADAAAVAFLAREPWIDTLVEVIRHISHDEPFNVVMSRVGRTLDTVPLIIAEHRLIDGSRISGLGERWARRLERRAAPHLAQELRGLASLAYTSEVGAATRLVKFAERFGVHEPEPRYLKARTWLAEETVHPEGPPDWAGPGDPFDFGRDPFGLGRPPARAFVAHRWHVLAIQIAPPEAGETPELPAFPDHAIDWDEDQQPLNVVLTAPGCDVAPAPALERREALAWMLQSLRVRESAEESARPNETGAATAWIWSTGPSSKAVFFLNPRRLERFKARVLVLHANRILQTAILEGDVVADGRVSDDHLRPIKLAPEGMPRSSLQELNDRRKFDLALLTNDSLTGVPQLTAVAAPADAHPQVWLREFDEVKQAADRVAKCLQDIVDSPDEFTGGNSPALTALLMNLAHEGVLIRDALKDAGLRPVLDRDPDRLQVVAAKPDLALPIELIYDGQAPNSNSTLCPNQGAALASGSCGDCPHRAGSAHICAMRFWGMRKVIERQMYDDETAPMRDFVTMLQPSPGLKPIGRPAARLFGGSKRAAKFKNGRAAIARLKQQLAGAAGGEPASTATQLYSAETWKDWRGYVQQHAPTLLVLLPHTDVDVLEIGQDLLPRAQIDSSVVGAKNPVIVLLLGCETASAQVRYASYVARFRHAEAAIVVGTFTPILGRHAAPIASALVERLDHYWAQPRKVVTLGDAMAETRRAFMSRGLPTGLALVAFGDADWLLGT